MNEIIVQRHCTSVDIFLNRPAQRNALNHPLVLQLHTVLQDLNADCEVRAWFKSAHDAFPLKPFVPVQVK